MTICCPGRWFCLQARWRVIQTPEKLNFYLFRRKSLMDLRKPNMETKCVQEGYKPKNGEPRIAPIVQSTTYQYDKTEELAAIFDLKASGFMYTRLGNPTLAVLEEKIASMEGGAGALTTASGQSATLFSIINICKAGQNFISLNNIYGGSHTQFHAVLKNFGIEVRYVSPDQSMEEILKLADENTRLIFGETIGNPTLDVLDFEKFNLIAKQLDIPFVVDNTFATPFLCRPIEYGADIVVHSTTKYIDGHATCMGGIIVDSGKFNWEMGNILSCQNLIPIIMGLFIPRNSELLPLS